jgi:glycosyltransferase involved in cell wall biosynthesis
LRIGIDLRPLGGQSGRRGVGSYLRGLVGGLLQVAGEEELVLFHQAGGPPPPIGRTDAPAITMVPLTRPRRAATIWDQLAWPSTLSKARVDLFHSPFWTIPVWAARRLPVVQTIHDLTPLKIRGSVSLKNEMIFRANFACARMARRVIVPSRATMTDAVALAGIRSERIRTVPEGVEVPAELLEKAEAALPALRRSLRLEGRYVLHTGGQDLVKNIEGAVRAVSSLVERGAELKLVVTGDPGKATAAALRTASEGGLGDRLVLSGFLEEVPLFALYRGAAALLYPSRNEGFGLPVLEAMACGTPVVAARAGALPEVGGDACLYADPESSEELAAALASILSDDALARRLSEAGRQRASLFTWLDVARQTLGVYREAVGR